jgi:hypothetical protein
VIDLTGSVLVRTRDHAPIAALCASRVGTEDRGKAWRPPMVICVDEGTSRSPGAGRAANARIGLQVHTFAFRCYGQDRAQAAQLARLVSDLWHECGTVEGTGDPPVLIRQAWADLIAKPIDDPGLKRPYATCYVDVLGGVALKGVVPMA